jgi:biotin carboxyl carrier protein
MEIPFSIEGVEQRIKVVGTDKSNYEFKLDDQHFKPVLESIEQNKVKFVLDDHSFQAFVSVNEAGSGTVSMQGFDYEIVREDELNEAAEFLTAGDANFENNLFAPMPGKVIKVNVKAGDQVKRGTILLVVEAMKMENNITAELEAVVEKVTVKEGDMVDTDFQLVYLEPMKD